MAAKWIEALTGSLEQKKQYKQHMARVEALPEPYSSAAKALNRYFTYYGGFTDGDTLITMIGDHADLWSAQQWTALLCVTWWEPIRWTLRRRSHGLTRASNGWTRSVPA